jgi:DNA polymerase elongation subunit (family B)
MTLSNTLFIDIETTGMKPSYEDLDERWQSLWEKKAQWFLSKDDSATPEGLFEQKSAIYAEFGRVVCISTGLLSVRSGKKEFRIKSFASENEAELLLDFNKMMQSYFNDVNRHKICGHNIKEFDVPYICRRMITNGIELPALLQISGKKPWELNHLVDTLELWKFGDYKHYTSLDLLSAIFKIPSPKGQLDGSQVHRTFYEEGRLDLIKEYCELDVWTTAQVYAKLVGDSSLEQVDLVIV